MVGDRNMSTRRIKMTPASRFSALLGAVMLTTVSILAIGCGSEEQLTAGPDSPPDTSRPGPGGGVPLAGEWIVSRLMVDDLPRDLAPGAPPTVSLKADGALTVHTGCNPLDGSVVVDDTTITVNGGLVWTEMGCDPALMDQQELLARLFSATVDYRTSGSSLTLSGNGVTAVLEPAPPAPAAGGSLRGSSWELAGWSDPGPDGSAVSAAGRADLTLSDDGMLSAFGGCSTVTARTEGDGRSFRVSDVAVSPGPCEASLTGQDAAVIAVLRDVVAAELSGDSLTLTAGDGRSLDYRRR
jgi:heat shock protein HslJ